MRNQKVFWTLGAMVMASSLMLACNDDSSRKEKEEKIFFTAAVEADTNKTLVYNESRDYVITYKIDGKPAVEQTVTLEQSNPSCTSIAPSTFTTDSEGKALLKVLAGSEKCDNILTAKAGTVRAQVHIQVAENSQPIQEEFTLEFINFNLSVLNLEKDANQELALAYKKNGQPVADAQISFKTSKDTCAVPDAASKQTDAQGQVSLKVKAVGEDCDADFTLMAPKVNPDKTLKVSVASAKNFVATLTTKLNDEDLRNESNLHTQMGLIDRPCSDIFDLNARSFSQSATSDHLHAGQNLWQGFDSLSKTWPVAKEKVLTAYAFVSVDTEGKKLLAYACDDNVIKKDSPQHEFTLVVLPLPIEGEYFPLVSNFDLISSFKEGAHDDLPKAEDMNAGDWVKFVQNFVEKPEHTLVDFALVNTLYRAVGTDGKILGQDVKTLKNIAVGVIAPFLKDYLDQGQWKQTFNHISGDVNDIVSNLQLMGEVRVSKAGDAYTLEHKYSNLQYRWSLNKENCITDAYGASDTVCKRNMGLKKNAIQGTAKLSFTDKTSFSLAEHDVQFRWASILYSAVFGEILPNAFDYKGNIQNINNEPLLTTAFLERFFFKLVVDAYVASNPQSPLKQTEPCQKFIEVIAKLLSKQMNQISETLINTAAGLACGNLNKLDGLVTDSLKKLEDGSSNLFKFSSSRCLIHSENGLVVSLGKPDSNARPIYEIDEQHPSLRCPWDVQLKVQDKTIKAKGYYHALKK